MKKPIYIVLSFISFFYVSAQELQQQNLIFTGKLIENAIEFETRMNSKIEKNYATIVLAPELYPYVDQYELNNPKQISRDWPENSPANVEYFYDTNSREIKYTSYKWAFINKIDDDTLFDRKKLKELVEKECGELEAYHKLFSKLERIIDNRFPLGKKDILENKPKKKVIEWSSEDFKGVLKLEFQDCNRTENLLPGWFMISFIEYFK